jgi:hypothetical protein
MSSQARSGASERGQRLPSHGERVVARQVRDGTGAFWIFVSIRRDGTEQVLGGVEPKA